MKTKFGALEILIVAETIERDGIEFYRQASRRFGDEELRQRLLMLADWERKHEDVFAAMKRELMQLREEGKTFDVFALVGSNPLALKSLAWSATQSKTKREFTGAESQEEILELAISRERNTIRFYYDLKDVVEDAVSTSKIHDIIEEEKRHVTILRRSLEQLRDPHTCGS